MQQKTKAGIAFALLCFFWGTTYLGIKVAIGFFPPFYLAAVRHLVAGIIFVVIALLQKTKLPSSEDFKRLTINGLLMVVGGNGLVCYAEQYISSGLTAIICALSPMFITLMSLLAFKGFRITSTIILGLLLGFSGILLISYKGISGINPNDFGLSVVLLLFATLSWGLGSIFVKKYPVTTSINMTIGMQMLLGGTINMLISFCLSETPQSWTTLPSEGYYAMLYLIVFGSLVGYAAYLYVLSFYTPARVSIHSYINTIVAVTLGFIILHEHLDIYIAIGMVVTLIGVIVTNQEYNRIKSL